LIIDIIGSGQLIEPSGISIDTWSCKLSYKAVGIEEEIFLKSFLKKIIIFLKLLSSSDRV